MISHSNEDLMCQLPSAPSSASNKYHFLVQKMICCATVSINCTCNSWSLLLAFLTMAVTSASERLSVATFLKFSAPSVHAKIKQKRK